MDKHMIEALEADGEKLRQLTGEDHGPRFDDFPDIPPFLRRKPKPKPEGPCPNCNGTRKALYFSEQAWAHEERECHVCR